MPTSHIQRSPAEFVNRQYFSPEIYRHFSDRAREAPFEQVARRPSVHQRESGEAHSTYGWALSEFRLMINRSVDARPTPC